MSSERRRPAARLFSGQRAEGVPDRYAAHPEVGGELGMIQLGFRPQLAGEDPVAYHPGCGLARSLQIPRHRFDVTRCRLGWYTSHGENHIRY
jgi:hypothetical protein